MELCPSVPHRRQIFWQLFRPPLAPPFCAKACSLVVGLSSLGALSSWVKATPVFRPAQVVVCFGCCGWVGSSGRRIAFVSEVFVFDLFHECPVSQFVCSEEECDGKIAVSGSLGGQGAFVCCRVVGIHSFQVQDFLYGCGVSANGYSTVFCS
jgi:hypothetical protein